MKTDTTPFSHPRFWQPGWWIPHFDDDSRRQALRLIEAGASPSPTYYLLLVLSTLIAGYGLLSNSTGTVIGAMILAPLIGPIQGLAMGIVVGDARLFRTSLVAELSGGLVVVLTAFFLAQVTGVGQVDFMASEIASRTRPTLFDLAIGLAAGLAGAFCLIHPALKVSAAGVAIAVALEPPLTVSGITAAGWLHGQLSYWPVFGSFMLFLANFLIIELAAGLLFVAAGFRSHRDHNDTAIGRTVVIQLLMLFATGLFLTQQLRDLVRERIGLAKATQVLQRSLLSIPGAELDSVKAELHGQRLEVVAVVGSRSEIAPEMVAEMEALIGQAIEDKPGQGEIRLVVRTVSSTWASSSGLLFEPPNVPPSPEQVQAQQLETALRGVLSLYPGVELGSYRLLPSPEKELSGGTAADVLRLELTLRSPYVFTPRMVLELQKRLDESLSKLSEVPWQETQLLVRTLKVFSATAGNLVTIDAPGSTLTQEQNDLKSLLVDSAAQFRGQELILVSVRPLSDLEVSLPEPGAPAFRYSASIQLRGDRLLTPAMVESWRDSLVRDFQTQYGKTLLLDLEVESELGRRLHVPASAPP